MSETTLNLSPSAALAALFSHMGRGLLWMAVRAFRAPLTTTVCALSVFGMVSATTNALYNQPVDHPAPFFTDKALVTSSLPPAPTPVVAMPPKRQPIVRQPVAQPIAPLPAVPRAVAEIGHDDVKLMQEKLRAIGLYKGDADGFYGPKTAAAIRGFEQQHGLPEVGALTPDILNRIVNQPQTPAPQAVVITQPTSRVVSVEQTVQQIARGVSEGSETLAEVANRAGHEIRTSIERAEPDRLTQIVQRVASAAGGAPASQPVATPARSVPGPQDKDYVKKVQRGLASLGFLHGEIDGIAGEGTARAIRNFEVYYNYQVTGAVTPELVDLLQNAGAEI